MKLADLVTGRLVRRYKRFLADVELASGEVVTAHTANPGRMIGLCAPGGVVHLTRHDDPKRKLKYTWRLVEVGGRLVGVDPNLANGLVREALDAGRIPELAGYPQLRPEVRYGQRSSRIDFLLSGDGRPPCYVEVKNVTLLEGRAGLFPDAVTARGLKHLRELEDVVREGGRGVLLFVVQRPEPAFVAPADAIDPAYGEGFRAALAAGVEALAYQAEVTTAAITLTRSLEVRARAVAATV